MTLRFTRWRPGVRAVPLALAASLIALPVAANENTVTPKANAAQVSLRQAAAKAATKAAMTAPRASKARRAEQASGRETTSWFKTKPGAIALAVMIVGTGYTLYSVSHDRITSPAKK